MPQTAAKAREKPTTVVAAEKGDLTAGEIKTRSLQMQQQLTARLAATAADAAAKFAARAARFKQEREAQLAADNARAAAEAARLRQIDAIHLEAARLLDRARTAAPADRAQIDRRATLLLGQLQQLRRVSVAPRVWR
jgi:hypothetical protein